MSELTTITYAEPVEISSKVGSEVDSKGNIKPKVEVSIKRKLPTGENELDYLREDIFYQTQLVKKTISDILNE